MTSLTSGTTVHQYQHPNTSNTTNAAICRQLCSNITASAAAGDHLCSDEAEQDTDCVTRGIVSPCRELPCSVNNINLNWESKVAVACPVLALSLCLLGLVGVWVESCATGVSYELQTAGLVSLSCPVLD